MLNGTPCGQAKSDHQRGQWVGPPDTDGVHLRAGENLKTGDLLVVVETIDTLSPRQIMRWRHIHTEKWVEVRFVVQMPTEVFEGRWERHPEPQDLSKFTAEQLAESNNASALEVLSSRVFHLTLPDGRIRHLNTRNIEWVDVETRQVEETDA